MVDTVRTQIELLTSLFQDGQNDAEITPQDMRDFIVSTYSRGRQVVIAQKSDLPTQVGGIITLATGTDYLFVANVNLVTDVLLLNDGSTITASSPLVTLSTSSTTALLTSTQALEINNITLYNATGPCINATVTGSNSVSMNRVRLLSALDDRIGGAGAGLTERRCMD